MALLLRFCFILFYTSVFLFSIQSFSKRSRPWSVSVNNAYTFKRIKPESEFELPDEEDSEADSLFAGIFPQTNNISDFDGHSGTSRFFSNLEIAYNMRWYEIGVRVQFFKENFASPYVKFNAISNKKKNLVIPFFTLGFVPYKLAGVYGQLGCSFFLNKRYFAISPFVGGHLLYRLVQSPVYDKYSMYFHMGVKTSIYF